MSAPAQRATRGARLLPPPARARDWIPAGLAAGLCLGSAELAVLALEGVATPPLVGLAVVGLDAAAVGLLCTPVALAHALSRARLDHSALVAGVVGALLGARALPLLLLPEPAIPAAAAILVLALAVGAAAAFTGGRLEASGVPIPGPPLWLAVSALLAGAAALRPGGAFAPSPAALLVLGAVVLLLALLAVFLATLAARRDAMVPWPLGRLVAALALLAAGVAFAPRALPWLLMEPPDMALRPTSPTVLLVDLGVFPEGKAPALGGESSSAALTLLATQGTYYRRFLPGPEPGAGEWLRLADGLPVARALAARGYRVAAVGPPSLHPPGFGARTASDPDLALAATLGGSLRARLTGSAHLGREESPSALAAEARQRIASTRALEPERPLFLLVDFSAAPRETVPLDAALGSLVELLDDLGLDAGARIAVVWHEEGPDGGLRGRAIVRPQRRAVGERGRVVEMPVLGPELAGVFSGLLPAESLLSPPEAAP